MKRIFFTKVVLVILTIAVLGFGLAGCVTPLLGGSTQMSEEIYDKTVGMNGSFEVTESGLPVNWLIYTPETIPTGDYELIIDTTDYKDGKQSLKFLVRECSPNGGWHSPGFCQEYEAIPGELYRVSFWVKNEGSEFCVVIGGVSTFDGNYETIVQSNQKIDTWKHFEYNYKMPLEKKFDTIRFEMNILSPGSFWIDDIKIEGINGESVILTAR